MYALLGNAGKATAANATVHSYSQWLSCFKCVRRLFLFVPNTLSTPTPTTAPATEPKPLAYALNPLVCVPKIERGF